jgi:hypothetical protein
VRCEGRVPILSYETWLAAEPADVHAFTAALGGPVRVVAYVRSPVQWLASLYYQRDYTCEPDVGRFLAKWLPKARWADAIDIWQSAPGVEAVDARLHGGDICADFCRLLGCEPSGRQIQHNQTFPAEAVRLLERHPLPGGVSQSEAKFALWRWLPPSLLEAGALTPTPFPFEQPLISEIIAETREASRRLLDIVDADSRGRMEADPRWWSDDAVHHLPPAATAVASPTSTHESDALAVVLWQCLLAADTAWRQSIKR